MITTKYIKFKDIVSMRPDFDTRGDNQYIPIVVIRTENMIYSTDIHFRLLAHGIYGRFEEYKYITKD